MNELIEKMKEEKNLRSDLKGLKAKRKELKSELISHRDKNSDDYNTKMNELRSIENDIDTKQELIDTKVEEIRNILIENTRKAISTANGSNDVDKREEILKTAKYRDAFFRSLIANKVADSDKEIMNYGRRDSNMDGGSVQEGSEYLLPTTTMNNIYSVIENFGRVWAKVTKYGFTGVVSLPIGVQQQATKNEDGSVNLNYKFTETLIKQDAIIAKIVVKNILLKNSISALESYLVKEIGKYIGTYLDYAVIHGDGHSFKGILEFLIGKEQKYTDFDYNTICDIQSDVDSPYGDDAFWVMTRKTFYKVIKKISDKTGKPISVELPITSGKGTERYIEGQEVVFTNAMQNDDFLFGDLSQYIVNVSQDTVIEKSEQEEFSSDKTVFRGKVYAGGSVVSKEIAEAAFALYIKNDDTVSTPTANPGAGQVSNGTKVTLSSKTEGAKIKYTLNGSDVLPTSKTYTEPIEIKEAVTIKAKAFKTGMSASEQASFEYTIQE